MRLLAVATLSFALISPLSAETVVPVGSFRSVELRNGGRVVLRYGAVPRVTIVDGEPRCTSIEIESGQRLVIDNHRRRECGRDHRLRVDVVTPQLEAVAVSNGGTLQTEGAFPARESIRAEVEQGGTIDIRSAPADTVEASVYSGGGIFTAARDSLQATIASGGGITYWGDPRVRKSVRDGGAVMKGSAAMLDKPLSEMRHRHAPPPVPPVPPVPPLRDDGV